MLHVAGDGYKKGTAAAVKSSREFSPVEKQFSSDECHAVSASSSLSGLPLRHTSDVTTRKTSRKGGPLGCAWHLR